MSGARPPRLAELLLRLFGPRDDHEFLAGDLAEGYRRRAESDPRAARSWYRAQARAAIRRAPFWRGLWLESLGQALRHGVRSLRARPGLTGVAILSLALGIGSSTAIFSVLDRMLLRPLDVEAPGDLFQVTIDTNERGLATNPIWEALRDRQDFLAGAFAVDETTFRRTRDGEVERILGAWVSGEFFSTLGIGVALGRPILPADDRRGCSPVAVLGHGFWLSEFGGDENVIGQTLVLSDRAFEVVGVAPPGFRGLATGITTRLYASLCGAGGMLDAHGLWSLRIVARRPEGMSRERLDQQLDGLAPAVFEASAAPSWEGERRDDYLASRFDVASAARGLDWVSSDHERALWMIFALGVVVVIATCANLATLLLARGEVRQREVAIQAAIGAGRGRIFGQAITESLLLAGIGSLLGLAVAVSGARALLSLMSTRWQTLSFDLSLDPRILAFTTILAAATALLFGLGPALRTTRVDGSTALLAPGRSGGGSRLTAARLSVAAQVAMSVVLVSAAGLLGGTFWHLQSFDPGFHREGLLLVDVDAERTGLERELLAGVYRQALRRLRADAVVRAAAIANITPVSGGSVTDSVVPGGAGSDTTPIQVHTNDVGDGYFETMGTPLLAGRDFDDNDVSGAPQVAIVNETLARRLYGELDVVGRSLHISRDGEVGPPFRIVGLVRDAKYTSLREPEPPTVYFAMFQKERLFPWMTFQVALEPGAAAVRAPGELLPGSVGQALLDIGPDVRLQVDTLEARVDDSLAQERMLAILSALFGCAALFLCAIGLHGVVSYGVARRTHEISVRTALGASRGSVLRLVVFDAGRLVVAGAVVGVAVSLLGRRVVESFAYGITPADPRPLTVAVGLLVVVALASCLGPARRAARNDPIQALRAD